MSEFVSSPLLFYPLIVIFIWFGYKLFISKDKYYKQGIEKNFYYFGGFIIILVFLLLRIFLWIISLFS